MTNKSLIWRYFSIKVLLVGGKTRLKLGFDQQGQAFLELFLPRAIRPGLKGHAFCAAEVVLKDLRLARSKGGVKNSLVEPGQLALDVFLAAGEVQGNQHTGYGQDQRDDDDDDDGKGEAGFFLSWVGPD